MSFPSQGNFVSVWEFGSEFNNFHKNLSMVYSIKLTKTSHSALHHNKFPLIKTRASIKLQLPNFLTSNAVKSKETINLWFFQKYIN